MIYDLATTELPTPAEVGGKALALMQLTREGLPVPPGFVLSVAFFEPWTALVRGTPEWADVQTATRAGTDLRSATSALISVCSQVTWSPEQEHAVHKALGSLPSDALFAVRSSSPEEDLAQASFAGGYETTLGVTAATLLTAVRRSFASLFDERVLVYKIQHGFALDPPRIGVIVQQQIAADCAGVAFSINPVTNDYDEAVVDANWGLGETVVSGRVEPDHWVVGKQTRSIVDRKVGGKNTSLWLDTGGGTVERSDHRNDEFCLREPQLRAIVDTVVRVEARYEQPMDIEWAIANDRLYLLQARPITTYVPLAPEMTTDPGQRRVLYWDIGLVEGITSNAPMTPLTMDWYFPAMRMFVESIVGPVDPRTDTSPAESLLFGAGGRMYLNLSQVLTLISAHRLARGYRSGDALVADLLANVDDDRYRATTAVQAIRWATLLRRVPRAVWHSRRFARATCVAFWNPRRFRAHHDRVIDWAVRELERRSERDRPLRVVIEECHTLLAPVVAEVSLPALQPYLYYLWYLDRMFSGAPPDVHELVDTLKLGFADNVAVDMGISLYRMSRMLSPAEFTDLDELTARLEKRDLPETFLTAWDRFIARYGSRGPAELELANPGYGDDSRLALEQMSFMVGSDYSPEHRQHQHAVERDQAYNRLRRHLRGRRRRRLQRAYEVIHLLGHTRDTPKFLLVVANGTVRRQALRDGARLVAQGRLDEVDDIFGLTLAEIDAADADPTFDLRGARAARLPFTEKLARVHAFPHLIDSRGRIMQVAAPTDDPSILTGAPVSRGVATGRVKVLHTAREKPVEEGDVLVAYTTDPGWTPLFVRASAVVLEIGGVLQHGGVVAREYGKPCVAGIQGITTRLHDGQLVEVDGTAGVVRILDQPDHPRWTGSSR